MASVEQYQGIVQDLIEEYASHKPSYGEIDVKPIINVEQGQYQVMHVGWQGHSRVHGPAIHIEIVDSSTCWTSSTASRAVCGAWKPSAGCDQTPMSSRTRTARSVAESRDPACAARRSSFKAR